MEEAPRPERLSSRLLVGGLSLAVCGPLLAVSVRLGSVYALPKLLTVCLGALLACAGAALGRRARRTPLDLPLAAALAALLASAAASLDPWQSLLGQYRMYAYGAAPLLVCACVYYAAAWAPEDEGWAAAFLAAAAVLALYGVAQKAGLELIAGLPERLPQGRITSLQGSPVYLGACLAAALPPAVHAWRAGRGALAALGAAAALLLAAALALTLTRSAWLGAAAGVGAWALLRAPALPRLRPAWVGGAALALCAVIAVAARLRPTAVSDSARVQLWVSAARASAERPLLGTGPDTFQAALRRHRSEGFREAMGSHRGQANAHNDLLQALVTTGVLGLAAYLFLLAALARLAWRRCRAEPAGWAPAWAGTLAALFVAAKLNPAPLACVVVAAAAMGALAREKAKAPGASAPAWAAAALCALALAAYARLAAADGRAKLALVYEGLRRPELALRAFADAERLNPVENQYRMNHAKVLLHQSAAAPSPALGAAAAEAAVAVGRDAVRWRPNDFDSHQILGTALLAAHLAGLPGRLDEAAAAMDRALELDPEFEPLLESRRKVAALRGEPSATRVPVRPIAR